MALRELEEKLVDKSLEEKKKIVADILCDEWYSIDDYNYIKEVLNVFYKS